VSLRQIIGPSHLVLYLHKLTDEALPMYPDPPATNTLVGRSISMGVG
jgi:hypothetical protein